MIGVRGRTLIHHANVPTNIGYRVNKDAFRNTTILDRLSVIDIDGKQTTRHDNFCGSHPAFAKKLRSWGEAGVVNTRIWPTPKSLT